MKIDQREYDRVNARCIELSKQLRDSNYKIVSLENKFKEVEEIATRNTYGNAEVNLRKIKEVITSDQTIR